MTSPKVTPVQVIGLGGGGHAKVVIEIIRMNEAFEMVGLLDSDRTRTGMSVLGVPILGDDSLLPELIKKGVRSFFVGLGAVGDLGPRRRIYEMCVAHGMKAINAIHPDAIISPSCRMGPGITIMAGAVINGCASLGANVIVNTGAIIEHDCVLEDHVHVATGARLAGTVRVGTCGHVGAGAIVRENVTIGRDAIIGAGAVVIGDVRPGIVAVGVPARELKPKNQ